MDGGLMAQISTKRWENVRLMVDWKVDHGRIVQELHAILQESPGLNRLCLTCYAQPGQLCLNAHGAVTSSVHKSRLLTPTSRH